MPGAPFHGYLLAQDRHGESYEIINQARTAKYLSNPALSLNNVSICDILAFGGCETYAYGPERVVASAGNLDFPGTASEWASVPSGAYAKTTTDMCVIATVALDDWTPAGISTIVGRYHTTGNQRAWALNITTTGAVQWQWSGDGTTPVTITSSANLGATANGGKITLAAVFDADTGASVSGARFYTAPSPAGPWTTLGTLVTFTPITNINAASTSPTYFGSATAGIAQIFAGKIYYVSIRNGIGASQTVGGTEVFRFDADVDLVGYDATRGPDQTIVTSSGHPLRLDQFSTSPGLVATAPAYRCDLVAQTYTAPATDPAPWYNASYPESADALGFYVEEWTGLDDGHVRRNTTVIGGPGGGTQMGVVFAEGRTMAVNIMLFARSEQAMEYLFRWLSSTLNSVCATCATSSVLVRRYCGTTADPWKGVGEMRRVGVIQGLKWESEIGMRARCYIRRASFTLMAGDPCIYLPETTAPATAYDHSANLTTFYGVDHPPDDSRSVCRPSCSELETTARTVKSFEVSPMSAMAPVVTWTNDTTGYTVPFRAVVYFGDRDTTNPNPCGMPILGELYVRPLPPYASMRWDVTGRSVEFSDSSTGGWTPTWVYVDANDPPQRRFFAVPCGVGHVVMEPASMCLTYVSGTKYTLDGIEFNPPAYPSMDIALSERVSCP